MADQAPTVFGESDKTAPAAPANTSDTGDSVAILVGEGRKYKTVEDLAKAYINLDGFTEKLKGENAEFREKLAGSKTIEDVIERLSQSKAPTQDQSGKQPTGLSAEAIAKIVKETVTGLETGRTRTANLLKADAAMKKMFGDKAQEAFNKAADTPEKARALQNLAEVSPDSFVQLFTGTQSQSGSQTDSGNTINSAALEDTNQSARVADPGAKDYYDVLRKKEPRKFYSQEVQLAMHKAAQANPEKFFGKKNWQGAGS